MKVNFYLTVNKAGTVKTTKGKPSLNWDEISVAMSLTLPDMLFKKPQLQAEITIPDDAALPTVINTEISNNIKQAIESITGLDINLTVSNPDN